MTVALYSLITNQVMAPNLAMTGELTLKGKVMPIGGLKEKILAAKRNKIKDIIIPQFNKRDLDELEDEVKKGVTFHSVATIEEVLRLAFPEDAKRKLVPFRPSKDTTLQSKNEEVVSIAEAVAKAVKEALS
jgi:ATP-dependent Lon protease